MPVLQVLEPSEGTGLLCHVTNNAPPTSYNKGQTELSKQHKGQHCAQETNKFSKEGSRQTA